MGLYYYRARYYSPTLQRFISEDPIRFLSGFNLYTYVGNNPIRFRDPLGFNQELNDALEAVVRVVAATNIEATALGFEAGALALHAVPHPLAQLTGLGLDILALGLTIVAADLMPGVDIPVIDDNDPSDTPPPTPPNPPPAPPNPPCGRKC